MTTHSASANWSGSIPDGGGLTAEDYAELRDLMNRENANFFATGKEIL